MKVSFDFPSLLFYFVLIAHSMSIAPEKCDKNGSQKRKPHEVYCYKYYECVTTTYVLRECQHNHFFDAAVAECRPTDKFKPSKKCRSTPIKFKSIEPISKIGATLANRHWNFHPFLPKTQNATATTSSIGKNLTTQFDGILLNAPPMTSSTFGALADPVKLVQNATEKQLEPVKTPGSAYAIARSNHSNARARAESRLGQRAEAIAHAYEVGHAHATSKSKGGDSSLPHVARAEALTYGGRANAQAETDDYVLITDDNENQYWVRKDDVEVYNATHLKFEVDKEVE